MSIALLRLITPRLPPNLDDVSDALSSAHDAATDASLALSSALRALHTSEPSEAAHQLAAGIAALREALARAEECASPMVGWADRDSGDW